MIFKVKKQYSDDFTKSWAEIKTIEIENESYKEMFELCERMLDDDKNLYRIQIWEVGLVITHCIQRWCEKCSVPLDENRNCPDCWLDICPECGSEMISYSNGTADCSNCSYYFQYH